jgi:hypothetical protein
VIAGALGDQKNRVQPHSSLCDHPLTPITCEAIAQQLPAAAIMQ